MKIFSITHPIRNVKYIQFISCKMNRTCMAWSTFNLFEVFLDHFLGKEDGEKKHPTNLDN